MTLKEAFAEWRKDFAWRHFKCYFRSRRGWLVKGRKDEPYCHCGARMDKKEREKMTLCDNCVNQDICDARKGLDKILRQKEKKK